MAELTEAEEIAALRELVEGLLAQFDHAGCTCTFPSENCCAYARAISWDKHHTRRTTGGQ